MNVDGMADEQGLRLTTVVPPKVGKERSRLPRRSIPVEALGAGPASARADVYVGFHHPLGAGPASSQADVEVGFQHTLPGDSAQVSYFLLSPEAAKLLAAELENAIRLLEMKKK